jgi:hypothetical protein
LCDVAAMEDKAYCEEILLEPHLWSLIYSMIQC